MDAPRSESGRLWHIARRGQAYGPYTVADLRRMLREGSVVPHDLAWTPDGGDWRPLREALGLRPPQPAPPARASVAATAASPAARPAAQERRADRKAGPASAAPVGRRGWIRRHWRGELRLGRSYWVNTVLLSILVLGGLNALDRARGRIESDLEVSAQVYALGATALIGFLALFALWQAVGVWRAASRHPARGGRRLWAVLAKLAVVLQLGQAGLALGVDSAPALLRAWQSTEPVPVAAFLVRPLRGGAELEFRGEIRPGAAAALERALAGPAREARVLHLTSPGGYLGEAHAMAALVRRHRLTTYVRSECVSACPLIFVASEERVLREGARLGFHRPKDPDDLPIRQRVGMPMPPEDRAAYRAAGVPDWFLDRVDATPNASLWWPTPVELVQANLVRLFSDGTAYSAGKPLRRPDEAEAARWLAANLPTLAPLAAGQDEADSQLYAALAELMQDGAAPEDMLERALATLLPRALELVPRGPDAEARALLRALAAMEQVLARGNPEACPALARGGTEAVTPAALRGLKRAVRERVLEALGRAAVAAAGVEADPDRRPPPPDPAAAEALVERVRARLLRHPDTELRAAVAALPLLGATKGDAQDAPASIEPRRHCEALMALHRGLAGLPPSDAALAARWLIGGGGRR
ncbi:MAG: DUF4339 domain-containing protein [Acetobacteraceae bacterium]|nr:DUF4339 domain-containing protein [Acetobacteraceae bacterium]